MDNLEKWLSLLPPQIKTEYDSIINTVDEMRKEKTIYPPKGSELRALKLCSPDNLKVVIVGQDPYHEEGQANGLAFSVYSGVKIPPSLRNMKKELISDLGQTQIEDGDLTKWAEQGVLILNTVLTVEEGKANSHKKLGWQKITRSIFEVANSLPQPIVFMLWGGQAIEFCDGMEKAKYPRLYLKSTHPSPLSASRNAGDIHSFLGSKPYSKANEFLIENKIIPIKW